MDIWEAGRIMTKVMILCEDAYGRGFFKELTNRMKNEGLIPIFHVSVDRFYGACNTKLKRQVRAIVYTEF